MDKETLLDATRRLLAARPLSLRKIEAQTGLDYEWLSSLSQGRISDPGVSKVEQLHDFLAEQE